MFTGMDVKVELVSPGTGLIPTNHWYEAPGPPFTADEVKVTDVPAHTGLADAAIEMLTGSSGLTVIVTVFETAGLPVAQVATEVSRHATASLFEGT